MSRISGYLSLAHDLCQLLVCCQTKYRLFVRSHRSHTKNQRLFYLSIWSPVPLCFGIHLRIKRKFKISHNSQSRLMIAKLKLAIKQVLIPEIPDLFLRESTNFLDIKIFNRIDQNVLNHWISGSYSLFYTLVTDSHAIVMYHKQKSWRSF